MRIARVFPTKTNACPTDQDAYFGPPAPWTNEYDEVHISCQFTWDKEKAQRLAEAWRDHGKVKLGGVAFDGESDKPFQAGQYLKRGITITSRGCPNKCSFCMVRKGLIEFDDFPEGNVIQDNNILACSDRHWRLVMSMLRKQKAICFKGGLEKYRITTKIAEDLRSLSIDELWLACDQTNGIEPLRKAAQILQSVGFTREHLMCYVLIGDNPRENISRLKEVYRIGCLPFAQLYKPREYSESWKQFQRRWSRPAIIKKRNQRWLNMKNEEYYIQKEVIQYLDLHYPGTLRCVSPAAGFRVSMGLAMKMISMGYEKGTADLVILKARGGYHGFVIELKAPHGKLSPDQKKFLKAAAEEHYKTAVYWSAEDAILGIECYMEGYSEDPF